MTRVKKFLKLFHGMCFPFTCHKTQIILIVTTVNPASTLVFAIEGYRKNLQNYID